MENKIYKIIDEEKRCNLGKTSIDNILSKLKELGYIKRVGSNKTGYWEVIK